MTFLIFVLCITYLWTHRTQKRADDRYSRAHKKMEQDFDMTLEEIERLFAKAREHLDEEFKIDALIEAEEIINEN